MCDRHWGEQLRANFWAIQFGLLQFWLSFEQLLGKHRFAPERWIFCDWQFWTQSKSLPA